MKERCDREMAAALLLVLFRRNMGWDHNPKQLNNQQRGQHRRLGNAHGARDDLVEASCVGMRKVDCTAPVLDLTERRELRAVVHGNGLEYL